MAERDPVSGKNTTGHEWDGIKELNSPLPRWWVIVFYLTVAWAVGYWIAYPSWPTLHTYAKGVLGYTSRGEVAQDIAKAKLAQAGWMAKLKTATVEQINTNPELREYAMAGGAVAFRENCAPCHQQGGAGAYGFPRLAADRWIWGGALAQIQTTITHGSRWAADPETHRMDMPRFGDDKVLNEDQISKVADYVVALYKAPDTANTLPGKAIFAEHCVACHGEKGVGNTEVGAPSLKTAVWLYSGTKEGIMAQVHSPKMGVMPAWGAKLDEAVIKELTVYVHSLGGGR
ncbi:MAG: cytochrome-c oxidase, cbb3-type subunit III [Alphaproteobacteria bacterium]|nr:cytochrome-c oxidase, cbb3-type subunit III [Alphaproteobacteria bacterium]